MIPINTTYIIVIVIVLLLIYFRWKGNEKLSKPKKGGSGSKSGKNSAKKEKKAKQSKREKRSEAEELHGLIHSDMCNGMTEEEFQDAVVDGDLLVYIKLTQLYTEFTDEGRDPQKISVADYERVLE